MKKFLIVFLVFCAISCSSTDDKKDECENKLWSITHVGTQYYASYGPTAAEATSVEVNEATYDYYTSHGSTNDGSQCWNGTHH
jgi:hypothetical protein